jgi:hypothetical protein
MDWLANAFWARIGWAAGEAAMGLSIAAFLGLLVLVISAPRFLRQFRCKHVHCRETGKCDAICNDCGKNLGFIGRIRDAR